MKTMPEYTDGVLDLYQIEEDTSEDYPLEHLRNTGMRIWYRELSVYDTTRAKLSADSIEVDNEDQYSEVQRNQQQKRLCDRWCAA